MCHLCYFCGNMRMYMRVRFLSVIALAALVLPGITSCSKYETVKGDPMNAKIYTLKNGLKVYMSVNKEQPRLQTYIAVRNGGKNDPADNTGLAHYLEHIMFKGTDSFGTSDYAAEKPLLEQIEEQFNVYRTKTDPQERKAVYHIIDSLSYEASRYAIPNEYEKMMSVIGSQGTNAYTSDDETAYRENIPSNQIDSWARVQAERFRNFVVRGFHTELEAVYEEYNMYLNEDVENASFAIDSVLFRNHPYGKHKIIGTQQHLKNPSITAIRKQQADMYVPNNMAICVSGDFDPDEFVAVIEKYFGDWEPNLSLPEFTYGPEEPITAPVVETVYGNQSEFMLLGWRSPGRKERECEIGSIVSSILNNGKAGLIDINLSQQQKVLYAESELYSRSDYSELLLLGYPKEGQSLDEVRELLLAQVDSLRAGLFDESLIEAAVANIKLNRMRQLESNSSRTLQFVTAFVDGVDWADEVGLLDRLSKVTKADVIEWAEKYLSDSSYVAVYKRQGVNPKNNKIIAPVITPIATNRDLESDFVAEIASTPVEPIEPVFVDYDKDLSKSELRDGVEMLYKKNSNNDIVTATFRFDIGLSTNPALSFAFDYLSYLGTPTRSANEIAFQEYKIAGNHSFIVNDNTLTFSVNGLSENLGQMLDLVEDLMLNAIPDEEILRNLKADELMSRQMAKANQNSCSSALNRYVMYGPEYVHSVTLSDSQVADLTSADLLGMVRDVLGYQHTVLYYGPQGEPEAKSVILEHHKCADGLAKLTKKRTRKQLVDEPKVILAPYDSRQFNYIQYSDRGETFSIDDVPSIELFNEYFNGSMNSIVFQEMRESRALAYSAGATLSSPSYLDDTYSFYARIGSQNDKLKAAVQAFDLIINEMPESEKLFESSKAGIESVLRTSRTVGMSVLNSYLNARELELKEPLAKTVYDKLAGLTMDDLLSCQRKWIRDRAYIYGILGNIDDLDMRFLRSLGPVQIVSLDELFGFE